MVLKGIPATVKIDLEATIPDAPPKVVAYNTTIWFGRHKGKLACNVPGSYLLWCEDNVPGFKLTRSMRNGARADLEEETESRYDEMIGWGYENNE